LRKASSPSNPYGLSFTGGSFTQSWRRVSAGGDFISFEMPWKFTYGLAKNLEVFLVIPYVHNWARNVTEPGLGGERSADFGGLGDINLTLKYQLLEETPNRPTVTGLFAVDFPTGHHTHLDPARLGTQDLGRGAYGFTMGVNVSKWQRPFILYGNLWYSVFTSAKSTVEHEVLGPVVRHTYARDVVTLNLAAEYPVGGQGPWVALLEFYSNWELGRLFGPKPADPRAVLLGLLPGLEYIYSDKLAFALGWALTWPGKIPTTTTPPSARGYILFEISIRGENSGAYFAPVSVASRGFPHLYRDSLLVLFFRKVKAFLANITSTISRINFH
jgi:hypothetical protein